MPDTTSRFLTALGRVIRSLSSSRQQTRSRDAAGTTASVSTGLLSPGQAGPSATVEVDARRLKGVRLAYAPSRDGEPDPGEIVWTWVPYEENDGRGKDRPVAIVAASGDDDFLAVQLTSKPHDGERQYLALGAGEWDARGRPSWVDVEQIYRVHSAGMRREASILDLDRFVIVANALRRRYGWDAAH